MAPQGQGPIFSAISPSARQLFLLLRCIAFSGKTQARISAAGLRFTVSETSVMEAFVFLSKSLFTTYNFQVLDRDENGGERNAGEGNDEPEEHAYEPTFQISFPALLETLQIFTLGDSASFRQAQDPYDGFAAHRLNRHANMPFSSAVLGASGLCRMSYDSEGSSLSIHLSEASVTTTCDLTTYESSTTEDIPFERENLAMKTVMQSTHLADAVTELASANPTKLSLLASPNAPYLSLSASGPLGSATVQFDKDKNPEILETFRCDSRFIMSYNFAHIKAAYRAMTSASKVSVRADVQGVLSLQFLMQVEAGAQTCGGDGMAFVDFRIVPLVEGEGDEGDDDTTDDEI